MRNDQASRRRGKTRRARGGLHRVSLSVASASGSSPAQDASQPIPAAVPAPSVDRRRTGPAADSRSGIAAAQGYRGGEPLFRYLSSVRPSSTLTESAPVQSRRPSTASCRGRSPSSRHLGGRHPLSALSCARSPPAWPVYPLDKRRLDQARFRPVLCLVVSLAEANALGARPKGPLHLRLDGGQLGARRLVGWCRGSLARRISTRRHRHPRHCPLMSKRPSIPSIWPTMSVAKSCSSLAALGVGRAGLFHEAGEVLAPQLHRRRSSACRPGRSRPRHRPSALGAGRNPPSGLQGKRTGEALHQRSGAGRPGNGSPSPWRIAISRLRSMTGSIDAIPVSPPACRRRRRYPARMRSGRGEKQGSGQDGRCARDSHLALLNSIYGQAHDRKKAARPTGRAAETFRLQNVAGCLRDMLPTASPSVLIACSRRS